MSAVRDTVNSDDHLDVKLDTDTQNESKAKAANENQKAQGPIASSHIRGIFMNWNCNNEHLPFQFDSPASSENTSDSGQVLDMSPVGIDGLSYDGSINHSQPPAHAGENTSSLYEMPIVGYEVLEERNRFTIFKIQVIHLPSSAKWYVFRRYTDFVRLNKKLKIEFPGLRFALPPKRWFGNNFDPIFLEDRQIGLQTFINNIIAHNKICNSKSVRTFFCLDNPPSPHESLEESMALCHCLEQAVVELQECIHQRDSEIVILKSRNDFLLKQQEALVKALRLECEFNDGNSRCGNRGSAHDLNLALLDICEETLQNRQLVSQSSSDVSSAVSTSSRRISLPLSLRRTLEKVLPPSPLASLSPHSKESNAKEHE